MVAYLKRIYNCVAVNLHQLDQEITETLSAAWSKNTKATRSSQWKIYMQFCLDNGLLPFPASLCTVARFLIFKARTSKYGTVNNYLSAIINLHKYHGHNVDFRGCYFMKLLMEGLRQRLGDSVQQAACLSPNQLLEMSKFVQMKDQQEFMLWGVHSVVVQIPFKEIKYTAG